MQSHLRQALAIPKINGRRDFQFFVVALAPAFAAASALAFSSGSQALAGLLEGVFLHPLKLGFSRPTVHGI